MFPIFPPSPTPKLAAISNTLFIAEITPLTKLSKPLFMPSIISSNVFTIPLPSPRAPTIIPSNASSAIFPTTVK